MVTRVQDVVDDASLNLEVVHPGDLAREVRWVHVSELADPSPYLDGGELVLTAGVWRGRDVSATDFVRSLTQRDVVAVGWGLLHGDTTVPADVVAACRDSGVTLFAVPVATPFIAISQWFVDRIAAEREVGLRRALDFSHALLRAADDPEAAPLTALDRVCRLLSGELGLPVVVLDAGGQVLAATVDEAALGPLESWASYDVGAGGRVARLLVGGRDEGGPATTGRIESALPVVGLVLARRRAVQESERRLAGEAVALVLSEQDEAARVRLAGYGLDPASTLVAAALLVDDDAVVALRGVEDWLAAHSGPGVVAQDGDHLDVVLTIEAPASDAQLSELGQAIAGAASARAAGVGEPGSGLEALRRGIGQARAACRLANRGRPGSLVVHRSSGSHHTLVALHDATVVSGFREAVLGPVEEYDRAHGTRLVPTLRAFLEHDGAWKRCAEDLGLHVNTLRQRLARVESLTGRSVESTGDRVDFWLALRA